VLSGVTYRVHESVVLPNRFALPALEFSYLAAE